MWLNCLTFNINFINQKNMNAYVELFGFSVSSKQYEKLLEEVPNNFFLVSEQKPSGYKKIAPEIHTKMVQDWIENVLWAEISCREDEEGRTAVRITLKSKRTTADEEVFLNALRSIEYDKGYGIQELYGTIAFKDSSWLERWEYDGSEGWTKMKFPTEPDWDARDLDNEI